MPTIKISEANTAVDLDDLLSHIRRLGIAVGNPEMQRLQAVFAQAPELSRNELRNLLAALLAKDEWQRTQIGRVFDRLVPFDSEDTEVSSQTNKASVENAHIKRKLPSTEQETSEDEAAETETKEPFSWRNLTPKTILIASLAVLAALIIAIAIWGFETTPKQAADTPPIQKELRKEAPIEAPKPEPGEEPLKLIKTIDHWTPYIETRQRDPWPQLLPALLLLLGSGIGFSWLLFKVLEASRQQKANRPKPIKGSGRFHVSGVRKPADYHLLNGEQRREMNWGISRYQSEQPLNRLNIPLSVKRSAAAGMPQLAFEHSSQEREVWLWQDQSSMNPDLSRLADEIAHTLQRVNILVQRGYFRGLPSQVKSAQGEVIWSNRHDYPETEPLVVIFADADNFGQRQLTSSDQSDRTLQQLSHWPLLCFVDSSQRAGTLQRLLQPHDLECVLPQAVSDWLANQGQSRVQAADNCVLDSLHQWATACALPNRVIMEDEIRALHNTLGFDCAWQFHALTRYAKVSGRGFDFRANRTRLLNELIPNNEISEFAKKAVKFWIDRNGDLDKALQTTNKNKATWERTRKKRQLDRDTALLKLWLTDDATTFQEGVKTLYDLYADKDLQKDISRELSHYSCAGFKPSVASQTDAPKQIILPVAWNDLEAETQRQLLHCGFGGQPDPDVKLCWDKTTKAILAGLAAVMLLSVVASAYLLMPKPAKIMTQLDSAEPPINSLIPQKQSDDYLLATYKSIGRYQNIAMVKDFESMTNDEVVDNEFMVRWQRQAAQAAQFPINEDRPETSAQHWLLGTVAKPKRPQPAEGSWPDLSIAVIFGDVTDMNNRKLAAKLLDTGSTDQVLIGRGAELHAQHAKLLKQSELINDSQWIYINGHVLQGHKDRTQQRIAKINLPVQKILRILSQSDNIIELSELGVLSQNTTVLPPLLKAQKEVLLYLNSLMVRKIKVTETYNHLVLQKKALEKANTTTERLEIEVSIDKLNRILAEDYISVNSGEKELISFVPKVPFVALRGSMAWPVSGLIDNKYGSTRNEKQTWKGVLIHAPNGEPVRAIADGRIEYAGVLRGYGNIVIIQHDKKYRSLYAYNQKVNKKTGDIVIGGETIAEVGNIDSAEKSALYFEIRNQGVTESPSEWFP